MLTSYKRFWSNLFNFSGTASRADFWWPLIVNYVLGGVVIYIIQAATGHPIEIINNWQDLQLNMLSNLIAFLVWLGVLSLKFRRLHDTNHRAWWLFINLILVIGAIWFFILMILPTRRNRWA